MYNYVLLLIVIYYIIKGILDDNVNNINCSYVHAYHNYISTISL